MPRCPFRYGRRSGRRDARAYSKGCSKYSTFLSAFVEAKCRKTGYWVYNFSLGLIGSSYRVSNPSHVYRFNPKAYPPIRLRALRLLPKTYSEYPVLRWFLIRKILIFIASPPFTSFLPRLYGSVRGSERKQGKATRPTIDSVRKTLPHTAKPPQCKGSPTKNGVNLCLANSYYHRFFVAVNHENSFL